MPLRVNHDDIIKVKNRLCSAQGSEIEQSLRQVYEPLGWTITVDEFNNGFGQTPAIVYCFSE
jgi:hypothetical protein